MVLPIDGGGKDTLYDIYLAIRSVASQCASIGVALEEVPIVGTWVAELFWTLSAYLFSVSNTWMGFYHGYRDLIAAIQDLLSGLGVESILDVIFGAWRDLRDYPLSWLIDTLGLVMPSIEQWLYTPAFWVRDSLSSIIAGISGFFDDPTGWLLDLLLALDLDWLEALYTPGAFVTRIIDEYLGSWGDFFLDPWGYIRGVLQDLMGVSPDFWSDPWGYLVEYLLDTLDNRRLSLRSRLLEVGERVLRVMWEG